MSSLRNDVARKFKYNGVEQEEALGLDLYEMEVRQYDPAIARFTGIDPVTHHSMSTYTAFDNNPVYFADPAGANAYHEGKGQDEDRWKRDSEGNLEYVNDDGGDEVDYVDNVDEDGNVESTEEMEVETTTEECSTCEVDIKAKTPGSRFNLKAGGDPRIQEADLDDFVGVIVEAIGEELNVSSEVMFAVMLVLDPKKAAKQLKRKGRSGKQARLKEWANDPKASSSDRGWLKNDQRHIDTGNKNALRIPRNGRKSPGRKKKDKGYELAHKNNAPASKGNGYKGSLVKNHAEHKVETRIHRHKY